MYKYNAIVLNIVDGDTLDVEIDIWFKFKIKQRIRLARIDTPEKNENGYKEATDKLRSLCPLNSNITITAIKLDNFGRCLAEVESNDQNVSDVLLSEGYAKLYSRDINLLNNDDNEEYNLISMMLSSFKYKLVYTIIIIIVILLLNKTYLLINN